MGREYKYGICCKREILSWGEHLLGYEIVIKIFVESILSQLTTNGQSLEKYFIKWSFSKYFQFNCSCNSYYFNFQIFSLLQLLFSYIINLLLIYNGFKN